VRRERVAQDLRVRRAVEVRPGDVRRRDVRVRLDHPLVVLVGHRREHEVEVVVVVPLHEVGDRGRRPGVVGSVEDGHRLPIHDLEPPRPRDRPEPRGDRVGADVCDLAGKRRRYARVGGLMGAQKREVGVDRQPRSADRHLAFDRRPHSGLARDDIRVGVVGADGDDVRDRPDRRQGVAVGAGHERRVLRGNLGLVAGDLLDSVAEELGVLEADARDRAGDRIDRARGVVPAADPDFQNRDIDVGLAEMPERDRGQHLEVGRLVVVPAEPVDTGSDLLGVPAQT
jgi:hypothetical protein